METKIIQSDFDKLALWDIDGWNHNNHYHNTLLKHVPSTCAEVLEIGCGTGSFSRRLAQRAKHVQALDLSPDMIKIARQRSEATPNIAYQVADAMQWPFPTQQYDCIVSIATLHHLPFEDILQKMKSGLKKEGRIIVLDLYESEGIRDLMTSLLALPIHTLLKLKNTGRLREPKEVQAAWAEHGKHDTYLPLTKIHAICQEIVVRAENWTRKRGYTETQGVQLWQNERYEIIRPSLNSN